MNSKVDLEPRECSARRAVAMAEYVCRRNGVPAGAPGGLQNMFRRSLGAKSFAVFWQHRNPVFGDAPGRHVYLPLKGVLPPTVALVGTFVFCGAFHDIVTTAVRGSMAFFFTLWFFFLGVGVVLGSARNMDLSGRSRALRATSNLTHIGVCLAPALFANSFWGL
jgi:hypothetical protein